MRTVSEIHTQVLVLCYEIFIKLTLDNQDLAYNFSFINVAKVESLTEFPWG